MTEREIITIKDYADTRIDAVDRHLSATDQKVLALEVMARELLEARASKATSTHVWFALLVALSSLVVSMLALYFQNKP